MYITARERQILDILLAEQEITVKDLAREIEISVRTIHRDLKGVEAILAEYGLQILKKSGVGIQLAGEKENIEALQQFLFQLTHHEYTPEERQLMLLCTLLESTEPVKLFALAHDLHVTIATVSNDLNKLEERIVQDYQLSLVRKRGYGVEIVGSETLKRKAMSNVISEHMDEFDLLSLIRESIQKRTEQIQPISERLLGLVDKNKLFIVERAIDEFNKELPYSIADSAYMGLIVHLALALERILQGENITINEEYLERLQMTNEYHIAVKMAKKLENAFHTTIPKAEIGYITMHLRGAKLRYDKEFMIEDTSLQIAVKARSLIRFVEQRVNEPLSSHHSLLQGLVAHLSPAVFRIKQNMGISNPLLSKIKHDYAELFSIVKEGVETIFSDLTVPEEEIGYLVLHFGSVLLHHNSKLAVRALIVCSSGIGTSKMLATRVKKEITAIKEVKNVSTFELYQMDYENYDLILSTIRLPEFNREYILVNPFLDDNEVEKIKAYIRTIGTRKTVQPSKKDDALSRQTFEKEQMIEKVRSLRLYLETIETILASFGLQEFQEGSITDLLQRACARLKEQGIISDEEAVFRQLLKREKLGGLGIPDTKLALYHTRSHAVNKPAFFVFALRKPLPVIAMDQSEISAERILLLLSPESLPIQALEVLSHISASIIESAQSIQTFQSQDAHSVSAYLAESLEQFYYQKVLEMRRE